MAIFEIYIGADTMGELYGMGAYTQWLDDAWEYNGYVELSESRDTPSCGH